MKVQKPTVFCPDLTAYTGIDTVPIRLAKPPTFTLITVKLSDFTDAVIMEVQFIALP